jgi:hypothetical protein
VPVVIMPLAIILLGGILALASHLERRRVTTMVRMTVRSKKSSPEQIEALLARQLAPILAAHGFDRR